MGNKQPLVSVVISCYNHEKYIKASILSILNQTYKNIELIVYDDGSTDDSPKILEKLAKEHNFFFKRHDNIGYTATLNKALKKCNGKYITILGSDDISFIDKIEKQIIFLEKRNDIAVCGGNILSIDGNGQIKAKQRLKPYREVDFRTIFANPKLIPAAPTAMIRADVITEVGGYDPEIVLEDLYMWLKITNRGYKIAVLNDVLVYYREHETNTHKNYRHMVEHIEKTYSEYKDNKQYPYTINKFYLRMFLKVAKKDKKYAFEIMKKINPRFYNLKFLRALFHLVKPRLNIKRN